jgi:hypothetical protein
VQAGFAAVPLPALRQWKRLGQTKPARFSLERERHSKRFQIFAQGALIVDGRTSIVLVTAVCPLRKIRIYAFEIACLFAAGGAILTFIGNEGA